LKIIKKGKSKMKKLFTAVVALVICLSLTLTSFAAVTIGGTFTDGTDVYVYGSYEGEADEVGVKVGERTYPLSEKKMFQANKFGKFVIGLRDAMNILGLEFDVAPYTVSGENEVTGEAVKAEKEVFDSITAVTVNGKMVSEFYQGTTETEFYYGLSELPEEASGLPPVAVKAGAHEFELKTEAEFEGWAVSAYHEGAKLVTVHFRKFAEFTTTALPKIHYHTRHHYIDINMSADIGEKLTQSFFFRTKGESIYDDTESTLGYTYYNVEAVEGYAPVAYNISRVYVNQKTECTEGVSVWNYDGDLSNETFTSIADISAAVTATPKQSYYNPVLYFKGFNPIEEYKVALISTQEQSLASFDSTTVKEGANFIIMKNETENNVYASFYLDTVNYPWKMTVKYVEKNPVDETMQDTSLAEIKVGGVAVPGVNAETKAYYYGVEDVYGELPEVTAAAAQAEKGATVSIEKDIETKITVTAADGVTKETYTLSFRPIKTLKISAPAALIRADGGWKEINSGASSYIVNAHQAVISGTTGVINAAYLLYNLSSVPADAVITGIDLGYKYKGTNTDENHTVQYFNFKETATRTIDGWVNAETGKFKTSVDTSFFAGLDDTNDDNLVAEASFTYAGSDVTGTTEFDLSKLTVSENKNIILIVKKKHEEGDAKAKTITVTTAAPLTVKYVEKNLSIEKEIAEISVGGKMVSGFVPGELKADYYYGMDTLPETAETLPAVMVKVGVSEFETVAENEYKGYAVTAYNNGEKLTTVHFREFSEETVTISPTSVYQTSGTTFSTNYSFDGSTTTKPSVYPVGGINPTVAYWGYDIPEKTGYAPVAYVLNGVRVSANSHNPYASGVIAYNGDGTQKETKTIAEIKADSTWVNSFANYKGFTQADAYMVGTFNRGTINNNVVSNTVNEGRHYIIYRTIEDTAATSQLYYDKSNKNYYFKMTVKYVEKNPVDPRPADATLSSIKINGEEIEGFSSDVTTYYYPVESLESIPEDITAAATCEDLGATAEVVEYDDATGTLYITGTSANGAETKNYMIKFREIIKSEPISYHSLAGSNESEIKTASNWFGSKEHIELYYNYSEAYMAYQLPVAENIRIVSASLNNAEARWYDADDDTIEIYQNSLDFGTIYADGKFTSEDVVANGRYVTNSDAYKLASYTITSESTTANTSWITKYVGDYVDGNAVMPLDVSKLKVYDGGVIIIYAENTNSARRPYLPGTLSVEYIICD